VRETLTWRSWQ